MVVKVVKVFLGRAKVDYGSKYENCCIEKVKEKWEGCEIIEFPDIGKDLERGKNFFMVEREIFFPLIDNCDVFVALPVCNELDVKGVEKRGTLSTGVRYEIKYAQSIGKPVYIFDTKMTIQ